MSDSRNYYSYKPLPKPKWQESKDVVDHLQANSHLDPNLISRAISEIKYLRRMVELEKEKKSGAEVKLEDEILQLISYIDHLLVEFNATSEDGTYTFPDGHVWE